MHLDTLTVSLLIFMMGGHLWLIREVAQVKGDLKAHIKFHSD